MGVPTSPTCAPSVTTLFEPSNLMSLDVRFCCSCPHCLLGSTPCRRTFCELSLTSTSVRCHRLRFFILAILSHPSWSSMISTNSPAALICRVCSGPLSTFLDACFSERAGLLTEVDVSCCCPHGRSGHRHLADPEQETQACIGRGVSNTLGMNVSGEPICQGGACTYPRRQGKITHQPEDAPCGGFRPDLLRYPSLSHGSLRFEADDRRTQGFRAPHRWDCLTVPSEALLALVHLRHLFGPLTHRVAAVDADVFFSFLSPSLFLDVVRRLSYSSGVCSTVYCICRVV